MRATAKDAGAGRARAGGVPRTAWCPATALALSLACVLCTGPRTVAAQEGIGRLFFTPAQRQQFDEARRRPTAPEPVQAGTAAPAPPQSRSLSVDGIVRRNDGQATVWVNRMPTQAPQPAGAVRIGPVRDAADGADLRLPDNGRRVRIKVGQEVDVQSGRIQESYRQPPPAAAAPAPPDAAAPSAAGSAARSDAPRDAAVERILRELGRRLDEAPRAAEPAR